MRTDEEVMSVWEKRFAPPDPKVYRSTASTELAPPPADGQKPNSKASIKTEAPTKKPRTGFVVNGFGNKAKRPRRGYEALPAQMSSADCPHDAGWSRDGMAHGLYRLRCRKCPFRKRMKSIEAADRMMGVSA